MSVGPFGKIREYSHKEIDNTDNKCERPDVKPPKKECEGNSGTILWIVMKPGTSHKHTAAKKKPTPKRKAQYPKCTSSQRREEPRLTAMQRTDGNQWSQYNNPTNNINNDILHNNCISHVCSDMFAMV